ncbi:MAG: hypothetical protein CVV10_08525 [Gammaproteobacteria bacterium HGW-Gammaproteobacteria-14]|nr:MAG: hypothetical protein CVV10_08525 [Gammaproteobacteria bacterium HGW-Gammaproteobacteria-14]
MEILGQRVRRLALVMAIIPVLASCGGGVSGGLRDPLKTELRLSSANAADAVRMVMDGADLMEAFTGRSNTPLSVTLAEPRQAESVESVGHLTRSVLALVRARRPLGDAEVDSNSEKISCTTSGSQTINSDAVTAVVHVQMDNCRRKDRGEGEDFLDEVIDGLVSIEFRDREGFSSAGSASVDVAENIQRQTGEQLQEDRYNARMTFSYAINSSVYRVDGLQMDLSGKGVYPTDNEPESFEVRLSADDYRLLSTRAGGREDLRMSGRLGLSGERTGRRYPEAYVTVATPRDLGWDMDAACPDMGSIQLAGAQGSELLVEFALDSIQVLLGDRLLQDFRSCDGFLRWAGL